MSQVLVYVGLYRLARAKMLQKAQQLVIGMTALCIPADLIVTLVNPTGSKGLTILAFAKITFFFRTFLALYLRKASYREIPPSELVPTENVNSALDALATYRPPKGIQATRMATDFTRSFVAFAIAASASANQPVLSNNSDSGGGGDPLALAALLIVVLHTATECSLTTVYPGANLHRFSSFLVAEIILYGIHMLAASLGSIQAMFATESLVDQALFIWLFGSATAKVVFKVAALLGRIDFDSKLGLSNLDEGMGG
jgi:hypothetical protein